MGEGVHGGVRGKPCAGIQHPRGAGQVVGVERRSAPHRHARAVRRRDHGGNGAADETALPFRFTWIEVDRGYEDETEVPDAGVVVRVRHELTPTAHGTRITYRCEVDGPADVAAEVGAAVSADFPDVISALGARAERMG